MTQITLYETKQKQNRQLVVASVHCQQGILRSAKAAAAETVDKLKFKKKERKKKKKMDYIVSNLQRATVTAEAEAVAV